VASLVFLILTLVFTRIASPRDVAFAVMLCNNERILQEKRSDYFRKSGIRNKVKTCGC
jgi:hypothetical protein